MTQFLLNGKPATHIELSDRGLQYGDGFFTTMRVTKGRVVLWSAHWQRLQHTALQLGVKRFSSSFDKQALASQCRQLINQQAVREGVIRITITRGSGGRGYAPDDANCANILVALSPYPAHYHEWQDKGLVLTLAQQRLGSQPMLKGLKTLNRLEQVLLKQELAQHPNVDDLLVLDGQGNIAETTMANILWFRDGNWYTANQDTGAIAGVTCGFFAQLYPLSAGAYPVDHILGADQVVICNALLGFVPVKRIDMDVTTRVKEFSVLSDFTKQITRRMCENE